MFHPYLVDLWCTCFGSMIDGITRTASWIPKVECRFLSRVHRFSNEPPRWLSQTRLCYPKQIENWLDEVLPGTGWGSPKLGKDNILSRAAVELKITLSSIEGAVQRQLLIYGISIACVSIRLVLQRRSLVGILDIFIQVRQENKLVPAQATCWDWHAGDVWVPKPVCVVVRWVQVVAALGARASWANWALHWVGKLSTCSCRQHLTL